jgi:hypothetical protein
MSAVLTDGYTPAREFTTELDETRVMGNGVKEKRGALHEYIAHEIASEQTERKEKLTNDFEPYGMYWEKQYGRLVLRCHEWFVKQIEVSADSLVAQASSMFAKDEEAQELIAQLADALRDYLRTRKAINEMAGDRKLKQEMGDAEYQFTQAAKYWIDAQNKAEYALERGQNIDDNEQIHRLKEYASTSLREGYIISQAVIRASDTPPSIDFKASSKRVAEYSAKKLTEWFSKNRENKEKEGKLANVGAALDVIKFFAKR